MPCTFIPILQKRKQAISKIFTVNSSKNAYMQPASYLSGYSSTGRAFNNVSVNVLDRGKGTLTAIKGFQNYI